LLKVFNYNADCAVIGAFNANYHTNQGKAVSIEGQVSPADAPDLKGAQFAGFMQQKGQLWLCQSNQPVPLKLAEGDWEIITYAPVIRGVAVIGLADKFNSAGAVTGKQWNADGSYTVQLRDGGEFLAWAQTKPEVVESGGRTVPFTYDAASGRLSVALPAAGKTTATLRWPRGGK